MMLVSVSGVCHQQQMTTSLICRPLLRSGIDRNADKKSKNVTDFTTFATMMKQKKRRMSLSPMAAAAPLKTSGSSSPKFYQEVMTAARANFTQEISFQSKDKDISLAKTLLHISAEDEAFLAFNREMDAHSFENERKGSKVTSDGEDSNHMESMLMDGKRIDEWLFELDAISKEVEVELISKDIGCHLIQVLEAVNKVLFETRGFKRSPVIDSKCSYLHSVLSSRCGSGHTLFGIVNGRCVEDPKSKASDVNSNTLLGLDIATNRDIIGIYLANLIVGYHGVGETADLAAT
ncbi:hypothetical protein Ccrd_006649 [Cynara cardunculus var. scolymus]|uniref:Protein SirB1 N-terminal domain-containing protein n=1 Tax=Cynara cardunculus var. scolymus TaxID=59895 RepID=A0A124SBP8_CYNCS|nr:hypothetical protein Ccrd_006649 [Cynara cardunculus var. scolymus]